MRHVISNHLEEHAGEPPAPARRRERDVAREPRDDLRVTVRVSVRRAADTVHGRRPAERGRRRVRVVVAPRAVVVAQPGKMRGRVFVRLASHTTSRRAAGGRRRERTPAARRSRAAARVRW